MKGVLLYGLKVNLVALSLQEKFWHAFVQYMNAVSVLDVDEPIHEYATHILQFFNVGTTISTTETTPTTTTTAMSILEVDVLGLLVSLRFLTCGFQNIFQVTSNITFLQKILQVTIISPTFSRKYSDQPPGWKIREMPYLFVLTGKK